MKTDRLSVLICALAWLIACADGVLQAQDKPWRVTNLALSSDGRHLAAAYSLDYPGDNPNRAAFSIWLYDLFEPLAPPYLLEDGSMSPKNLAFSPDNVLIAAGNYYGVTVYHVERKQAVLDLQNSDKDEWVDFGTYSFSPDSAYLMAFSDWWRQDHDMHVWRIDSGRLVTETDAQRSRQWIDRPWLSPDWTQFFQWHAGPKGESIIYEFAPEAGAGAVLAMIDARGEGQAAFSRDSSLFAMSRPGGEIELYETNSWTLKNSVKVGEHNCDEQMHFGFSHRGSLLAITCRTDRRLAVWDYESGEVIFEARSRGSGPRFTADDMRLVVGARHAGIQVWTMDASRELTAYAQGYGLLHPDGESMITIGPDGYVWIWNIKLERLRLILPRFAG